MYAMIGIILPMFCRASNRTVIKTAVILMLQPVEWIKFVYAFFNPEYVTQTTDLFLPDAVAGRKVISAPPDIILTSTKNLSSMFVLVAGLLITFYRVKDRSFQMRFAPYGKTSLTNYPGQSIIGSLLFYHWRGELGRHLGVIYSFIFGIVFVLLHMMSCTWWLKKFKHGPFEALWRSLTLVNK